jgi:hypothetical protein
MISEIAERWQEFAFELIFDWYLNHFNAQISLRASAHAKTDTHPI